MGVTLIHSEGPENLAVTSDVKISASPQEATVILASITMEKVILTVAYGVKETEREQEWTGAAYFLL